jgi:hypothetical protein
MEGTYASYLANLWCSIYPELEAKRRPYVLVDKRISKSI